MRALRVAGWIATTVVLVASVAGCTGIPGSSEPQVVRTVGLGASPPPTVAAPPVDADQQAIVNGFLDAMASSPDRLDAARAYLDDDAAQRWNAGTVTIVKQKPAAAPADRNDNVKVTYQVVGTLSTSDGVYRPYSSEGLGYGATQTSTYALVKNSSGQWRIHPPVQPGLFITVADFEARFTPKSLYFLDLSGSRLVPDLRYSALSEPGIESYLLTLLAAGPRQELQAAVSPFDPAPTGNQRLSVTPGSPGTPTVVQVPGASTLPGQARRQLAAQLAFTLRSTSFQSPLQIQDGTQVVPVPGVSSTFTVADFADLAPVDDDDGPVTATHVAGGAVVDSQGKPFGAFGTPKYDLDSAVFDSDGGRTLVAGTTGPTGDSGRRRLWVGDASGLKDVGVPSGPLTTPAWAPIGTSSDIDEVWVGSGAQLYRFVPGQTDANGRAVGPTPVTVAGQDDLPGIVTSLAFSPEGTRLVLVIRSPDGTTSQVWLASVIRSGPDVSLGQLERLTPSGYVVADAGWRSETLLAAVGYSSNFPNGVYLDLAVDGSRLAAYATDGLPERPQSLAVSPRSAVQWVSIDSGSEATVWNRSSSPAGSWSDAPSQQGSAPSFST